MARMTIRVALIRVSAGLIGVTAMLAAVIGILLTLQAGAWIRSFGLFALGFAGLWLIGVARSYDTPAHNHGVSAPTPANTLPNDEL